MASEKEERDDENDEEIDENILKILVATDCHIGYAEKDPIRRNDSFNTFEEILQLAQENKVDMILHGGDLFHDNKPSRKTLHDTLSLLRKYCLGNKECYLQFVSDADVNFGHCDFKHVNYQDPNLNVAYPLFSVHGNHDDPTGEGSLSAIDILSTAGYLNHFGKSDNCDNINMTPVLLKKGDTKLALYGLGSMRDERLYKTFCLKKVNMLRPREDPDSWFNMFVIHQNRAKHGPKNHIPESFLDEFLDLVIWGHEHECLLTPTASESGKNFYVSQPGSSIATSLSEGESQPKKVGLLEIREKQFRMKELPLNTVRQFFMEMVTLSETGFKEHEVEKVHEYLTEKVERLIQEAENNHTGHANQPTLPLIRLKVEYSGGFDIVNPHRFGQQFVSRVANCKDILLFYKKKIYSAHSKSNSDMTDGRKADEISYSQAGGVKMEDLINEYLTNDDRVGNLSILSERKLSKALNEFVLKDEKDAIPELVKWQLRKTQKELKGRDVEETKIDEEINKIRDDQNNVDEKQEDEEIEQVLRESAIKNSSNNEHNSDLEMSDDEVDAKPARGARRGRGRRGGGTSGTTTAAATTTKTRGGRGSRARGGAGSRGGSRGRGKKSQPDVSQRTVSDSFISTGRKKEAVVDLTLDDSPEQQTGFTSSKRSQKSTRSRANISYFDDDDDDDDEDHNPFDFNPSKRARR